MVINAAHCDTDNNRMIKEGLLRNTSKQVYCH